MSTSLTDACEACGTPFVDRNTRGRRRQFCGPACRSRARRERAAHHDSPKQQPFARAIREAVDRSRLSLRDLEEALNAAGHFLSASSLSQWARGAYVPYDTDPTRNQLFVLERLSMQPTGSLVRPLLAVRERPTRPARIGPENGKRTMEEAVRGLQGRIASLDAGYEPRDLLKVVQTEHYQVGPERLPLYTDISLTVVPLRPGYTRYWHIYAYDPQAPVTVEAIEGCRAGLVLEDIAPIWVSSQTKYQLAATELLLGKPLTFKDHPFSLHMSYDLERATEPVPEPEIRRLVTTAATRELQLSVAFDPKDLPRCLEKRRWTSGPVAAAPTETVCLEIQDDGSCEPWRLSYPRPGGYGYRWEWLTDRQFRSRRPA